MRDWPPLGTREPISRFLPPMPFSLREPNPPSIGHFRRAASTRRQPEVRRNSKWKDLAPQLGFEPTTLRLTADPVVAASRCKHKYLHAQNTDYCVNWGESGGTTSMTTSGSWLRAPISSVPSIPKRTSRLVLYENRSFLQADLA